MLPNVIPFVCWNCPDGGLPPLAAGCGMGDGECAGEITRGLFCGAGSEDACGCAGALGCGTGDSEAPMEPKLMGGLPLWFTGPPFGIWPVAPEALITTEGFRP